MDNLPVFYGKCGYRFPDKGKVFGHGAGEGFGKLLAAVASVGLQAVFAQVDGHPEEPGLFMLRAFKGRGGGEKAEHGFLEDIFGIRQSGELAFVLGDIYTDANILKEASDAVEQLLVSDPELTDDDSRALVNYFKEHTAVNVVDFRTI